MELRIKVVVLCLMLIKFVLIYEICCSQGKLNRHAYSNYFIFDLKQM